MSTRLPMSSQPESDFVLFEDSINGASYRHLYSHPGTNHFPPAIADASFDPSLIGEPSISEISQNTIESSMNKQYYSLGTSTQGITPEIPLASAPPSFNHTAAYGTFSSADIPRTLDSGYMDDPSTSSAPDVLIHPPTFPYPGYHSRVQQPGDHRSTPSASPATSQGGFSGSEAGSARNSPYSAPMETNFRDLAFDPSFVDPSLISNSPIEQRPEPISAGSSFGSPSWTAMSPPVTSNPGSPSLQRNGSGRFSPSYRVQPYGRRPSTGSVRSWGGPIEFESEYYPGEHMMGHLPVRSPSTASNRPVRAGSSTESLGSAPGSSSGQSNGKEPKDTLCPECNKCFRDLRAHQLTHQLERPEKCPIATCEYSKKGFARKYDCQRHTLTHYKGTMVCGFCPGSGSPMEKSFNRADVFKRHLMAVHNVEQTAPNGRQKKTSGQKMKSLHSEEYPNTILTTGKCSTCNVTFANAQQFYEHLDDCVLSKVVQEEPAAAANEANLMQVKIEDVEAALSPSFHTGVNADDDDEEDEDIADADDLEDDEKTDETYSAANGSKKNPRSGSGRAPSTRSKSKTLSKRQGAGNQR